MLDSQQIHQITALCLISSTPAAANLSIHNHQQEKDEVNLSFLSLAGPPATTATTFYSRDKIVFPLFEHEPSSLLIVCGPHSFLHVTASPRGHFVQQAHDPTSISHPLYAKNCSIVCLAVLCKVNTKRAHSDCRSHPLQSGQPTSSIVWVDSADCTSNIRTIRNANLVIFVPLI